MSKRILGLVLIAIGISVWIIYAALKAMGAPSSVGIALAIHLIFVIPGAVLAPGENFYGKILTWLKRPKNNPSLIGGAGQMKVAIMAAGGLGGFLGAVLAKNGNDVTFIARGAHLDAIRSRGLTVTSVKGDFTVRPAKATDDPSQIGAVDWIIFSVKTYDSQAAAALLKPMIGANTTIVTVQNGVDSYAQLAALYGKECVLAAPIQIESSITAPGVIAQTSSFITLVTGEMDGRISPRVEWFVDQLKRHGLDASASDKMPAPIWAKMLFLASFAGLTTLARTEGAALFKLPAARMALSAAMQEVFDVARAHGVHLPSDLVEQRFQFSLNVPPSMTASMHKDLLKGNRLEIDALSGSIVRLGAEKNIATPVHATIYAALKMEDERARLALERH